MSSEPAAAQRASEPDGGSRVRADDTASACAQIFAGPAVVFTNRPDGSCDFAGPQFYEFTGAASGAAEGFGWGGFLHPDDREPTLRRWLECAAGARPFEGEYRLRAADGTFRWFRARTVPLCGPDGTVTRWVGVCWEIHEFKLLEQRRAELLGRERAARLEAESAARARDEFLSVLSHELRTPLTAMLGWLRLMRDGVLDAAENVEALAVVERNARAQLRLVEDLLEVSRIVTGKVKLDVRTTDPAEPAEAALAAVRDAAEAKGVALVWVVDTPAATVAADPLRLRQVFAHLLTNAVKFTPPGGRVEVRVSREAAAGGEPSGPDWSVVRVSDTGVGIDADFLPFVFDRFRQAETGTARRFDGLGLGLAIVRHLVELHGGTVRAESPGPGRGSVFTVRLPAARPAPAAPPHDGAVRPLTGRRVLLVEDNDDTRRLLGMMLRLAGAQVRSVGSGDEALGLLAADPPDVLVSDIGMPGMDGYELVRRLRRMPAPEVRTLPAIALTGFTAAEDRERAMQAGFQEHLAKPVELSALAAAIRRVIDQPARPVSHGPG